MAERMMSIKIDDSLFETFKRNCVRNNNKPYQIMIREIITAFNEGRVTITPTDDQKKGLKIYQED